MDPTTSLRPMTQRELITAAEDVTHTGTALFSMPSATSTFRTPFRTVWFLAFIGCAGYFLVTSTSRKSFAPQWGVRPLAPRVRDNPQVVHPARQPVVFLSVPDTWSQTCTSAPGPLTHDACFTNLYKFFYSIVSHQGISFVLHATGSLDGVRLISNTLVSDDVQNKRGTLLMPREMQNAAWIGPNFANGPSYFSEIVYAGVSSDTPGNQSQTTKSVEFVVVDEDLPKFESWLHRTLRYTVATWRVMIVPEVQLQYVEKVVTQYGYAMDLVVSSTRFESYTKKVGRTQYIVNAVSEAYGPTVGLHTVKESGIVSEVVNARNFIRRGSVL